jgi:hypothetical protein
LAQPRAHRADPWTRRPECDLWRNVVNLAFLHIAVKKVHNGACNGGSSFWNPPHINKSLRVGFREA